MKKLFTVLSLLLCLSLIFSAAGCAPDENGPTPPPQTETIIEISGVRNGGEYELENDTIVPVFNNGTATLAKDGGTPSPFTSGTAITEVGKYVLSVTDGNDTKTISFTVLYPAPIISGVVDHSTYYAGIHTVAPTLDRGEAEMIRNDTEYLEFKSGEEITEVGKYRIVATYMGRSTSCTFWIKEYEWTPGENDEHLIIDDFTEDNWIIDAGQGLVGTKTLQDGKITFDISAEEDGMFKTYRDITLNTREYSLVEFAFDDVSAAWDSGFDISISNRTVEGWPTVFVDGTTMNRVFRNGKWYVYIDLNDAVGGADALVGLKSVNLHFEIVLEGTDKSVTIDDISFVSEIPQGAVISGVENNATYTLGTDTVKPVFSEGTATLSRNGGAAEPFTSGTEISVRGKYVLSVIHNGIENIITFTVLDPTPGANGVTTIDDFSADDWIVDAGMVGTKTVQDGKITLALSAQDDGMIKSYRDVHVNTRQYSIVRFVFDDINTEWDTHFIISISNRNVAGWPTVYADGTMMNRILIDGKWHVYFDLNEAVDSAEQIVGQESVTLHFEISLEGSNKSVTLDDISFAAEIPQGPAVSGVQNNATYTLGSDTVKPVFEQGSGTLSRNGGEPAAFASGTEITESGDYVLTVTYNGIATIITFSISEDPDVIDAFSEQDWSVSEESTEPDNVELTYHDGQMTFKSGTAELCVITSEKTLNTLGRRYIRYDMTENESCWDAGFTIEIVDTISWKGTVSVSGDNFIKEDKPDGNGWYIYLELPEGVREQESITLTFKMKISFYTGKYVTLNEIRFVDEIPETAAA